MARLSEVALAGSMLSVTQRRAKPAMETGPREDGAPRRWHHGLGVAGCLRWRAGGLQVAPASPPG